MNVKQDLRRHARRAGVIGARGLYALTGATTRGYAAPGVVALLLHESPQGGVDRLVRHIRRRRERYTDFSVVDAVVSGEALPQQTQLVLTFDDGLASNLIAARALAQEGLQACFYIPTDGVGMTDHEADVFFRRRPVAQRRYKVSEPMLTWDQVDEMQSLGHVIGSHCKQHKPMADMSLGEAEDQLKGSIEALRARLGSGVRHFAWPFGGLSHAPVGDVVRWSQEIGVVPASGVRGHNTAATFETGGYLLRDAVEYRWIGTDLDGFIGRRHARGLGST